MQDKVLYRLRERAKELNCLYQVEEMLKDDNAGIHYVFRNLLKLIPAAWQYPTICVVRITYEDDVFKSDDFIETQWAQKADIVIDSNVVGKIEVFYLQFIRNHQENSQFLPEEQKLLNTISRRVGEFIFYKKLKHTLQYIENLKPEPKTEQDFREILNPDSDEHWKWRLSFAERIAEKCDMDKYGVKGFYVIGSTKNADAGPCSDIDLLIHHSGDHKAEDELRHWLEGWGLCLSEVNYEKTGHQLDESLIDVHFITDKDIENKSSYAVMINAVNNRARPLRINE